MKKIMILTLMLATQLSYTEFVEPAPKPKAPHDSATSHTDATQEAKAKTDAEYLAKNTQPKPLPKTPDAPTISPTGTPRPSESSASGTVHIDVEASPNPTITEVSHPDQNGFFSTKKTSTIITDHGDGTHSITNKEEVQGWFSNKTKATTTKYDTSAIKDTLNATIKNDPLAAKDIIAKKQKEISSQVDVGTKKYSKDGASIETIKGKDGKATATVKYDKNGTPTEITDGNGQPLSKSTEAQQAKSTFIQQKNGNLINSNEYKTSTKAYLNDDGHPVNEDGQLIDENGSLVTQDSEGDWRNEKGELIDESGNIITSSLF